MELENELVKLLINRKICSEEDILKAKEIQKKYHAKLEVILLNSGTISEVDYLSTLSILLDIKLFSTLKDIKKSYIEFSNINNNYFVEHDIYPFYDQEDNLYILISSKLNYEAIVQIESLVKKKITIFLGTIEETDQLKLLYKDKEETHIDFNNDEDEIEKLKELASEAPVIKIINGHLTKAVELKSSDIHYEASKNNMRIRLRIDGILQTIDTVPLSLKKAIIARLKLLSKMNISENRLPQDGRISLKISNQEIDIRASSVPTAFGESFVLRLLGKQSISYSLKNLDFFDDHLKVLKTIVSHPHGIFLTTGPTGSGKTTTLYSLLNELNNDSIKIISVEDPVEYQLEGINQIHVKSQIGFTFSNALRSILRQDPDIIMVGEIRDEETARISIQSALTGHLVLSTLHTNSALGAITRLLDMGLEYFLLKSSINGLMAQRLVRKLCIHCKEPYQLSNNEEHDLGIKELIQQYDFIPYQPHSPIGCEKCNHTGYAGRIPVSEIIPFNNEIKQIMEENKNFNDIQSLGYRTLFEDAILKFINGSTSLKEVMKIKT